MIPRTPALDAALAALESHTECGPQVRRLVTEPGGNWPDELVALRGWSSWPVRSSTAVAHFLDAVWDARLSFFPSTPLVDDAGAVLCGFAHACDSLVPFLEQWERRTDLPAMRHLGEFVLRNAPDVAARGTLAGASWSDRPTQGRQVIGWLHQRPMLDALEFAYFAVSDPAIRSELGEAADRLRALQPSA